MEPATPLFTAQAVIWLFPIAFMFHDLEEIIMVEAWFRRNRADLGRMLPARIAASLERNFSHSTAEFAVAVCFMLAGIAFSTIWAGLEPGRGGGMLLYAGALDVFFLHGFFHLGQAAILRRYTPGSVTSVLLVLPYSLWAFSRLLSEGLLEWKTIGLGLPVGILIVVPLLLAGHWAGKAVFRRTQGSSLSTNSRIWG
jgi:hypothetical protein